MLLLHAVDAVDNIDVAETLMALTKANRLAQSGGEELTSDCDEPPADIVSEKCTSLNHLTRLAQEEFKFLNSPTGIDESWSIASMTKMEQGLKRMKVEDLSLDGHYTHHCAQSSEDDDYEVRCRDSERLRKMSVSSWSSMDSDCNAMGKKIGSYSPEDRAERIRRYLEKRKHRTWGRKINYGVRKNFADSRLRVKGRFVKKEDEELLCLYLAMT
ncbi:Aste57867_22901 [Aphanomyces stellatus]|uniref:Aste57867_22901 protein n=1 Tax=Aphanomyces stellatus TaxID=120398 RepID=A0A485LMC4_9STRA|nr:hypothetical protein As57867_022830 [Aphanomyces stellatus]VFT99551.1 Aste57867_22901 [Aphanomyces stellatus]